ncbi:MAG: glycine zipper 2TM domain-containing protein [Alphaproteobacteria bacterium]|nr:glycine zipper 2TM domain-containing protein [Alphaproteobacteria bacterium]
MLKRSVALSLCAAALLLAGCGGDFSGSRYDEASVGEVSRTDEGTVISLRRVELKPDHSMAGTLLGGAGGALAGSLFGGGNGKILTTTAGAIAGGVAGNAIGSRAQDGIEYTVQLNNGSVVVIAQGTDPAISVGQRVRVVYSNKGRSRVVPA